MDDFAWQYPLSFVVAVGLGGVVFWLLTKAGRKPPPVPFQRTCTRCKLKTVGAPAESYLYCPFCGAKY